MTPLEALSGSMAPIDPPETLNDVRRLPPFFSGLYALVDDSEVVYVGISRNIPTRIYSHVGGRRSALVGRRRPNGEPIGKIFDSALWRALPWSVVKHYEGALIRHLRPKYNTWIPSGGEYDAEILFGFGLRDHLDESDVAWEAV